MGKLLFGILFVLALSLVYILLINIIANSDFDIDFDSRTGNYSIQGQGSITNIPFSESVSVNVKRERWYGTILENNGDSDIHTLGIKLPLNHDGVNYVWIHLFFVLILLIVIGILILV